MTSEDLMNCFPYFIQLMDNNIEKDITRTSYSLPLESQFCFIFRFQVDAGGPRLSWAQDAGPGMAMF